MVFVRGNCSVIKSLKTPRPAPNISPVQRSAAMRLDETALTKNRILKAVVALYYAESPSAVACCVLPRVLEVRKQSISNTVCPLE